MRAPRSANLAICTYNARERRTCTGYMKAQDVRQRMDDLPKSIDTETFPSSANDGCWSALGGLGLRPDTDIGTERSALIAIDGVCIGDVNMLYGLPVEPRGGEPGACGGMAPLGYMPGGGEPCEVYGGFSHPPW